MSAGARTRLMVSGVSRAVARPAIRFRAEYSGRNTRSCATSATANQASTFTAWPPESSLLAA